VTNKVEVCFKTLQPRGSHRPNRPSLISSGGPRGLIHLYDPDHTINMAPPSQRTKPIDSIPATPLTPDHTMQQNSRDWLLRLPEATNPSYFVAFKQQLNETINNLYSPQQP